MSLSSLFALGAPARGQQFDVDSDVTLDSIVQTGNGPQKLSTDVRFFPNTRRATPGEVVYWTLDLGSLKGPFTIIPELDNDGHREATIRADESSVVISHTYDAADIYVPYLVISDADGNTLKIHSRNVLGVVPDLAARQSLGVRPLSCRRRSRGLPEGHERLRVRLQDVRYDTGR